MSIIPIRLDVFLSIYLKCSRSNALQHIILGNVRVDGLIKTKASLLVSDSNNINLILPQQSYALDKYIIYCDDHIIIINKPSPLSTHNTNTNTFNEITLQHMWEEYEKPFMNEHLKFVHRLDKNVSGLMILPRNIYAYNNIRQQFEMRTIKKKYECMVVGKVKGNSATINKPIKYNNTLEKAEINILGGEAITYWQKQKYYPCHNVTHIMCMPITGRTHQIRCHLKSENYIILGDKKYGCQKRYFLDLWNNNHNLYSIALQSSYLEFIHPNDGTLILFTLQFDCKKFLDKIPQKNR